MVDLDLVYIAKEVDNRKQTNKNKQMQLAWNQI